MKSIEPLIKDILQHDLRGEYVAPNPKREKELGELIAKEVGATLECLCEEDRRRKTEHHIIYSFSARRSAFEFQANPHIEKIINELKAKKAGKIDVAFFNRVCTGNEWGDLARIAVRFTK